MSQAVKPISTLPDGPRWYLCKTCNGTGDDPREVSAPGKPRRKDCKSCGGIGEVLERRR